MDKSIIAVAIASFLATGLAIIMLRWAGRNPGVIGPEIDSPFFDVNVDSLDADADFVLGGKNRLLARAAAIRASRLVVETI